MIKNDKQLSLTKEQVKKFEESLALLDQKKDEIPPMVYGIQRKGLQGQLQSLLNDIAEYNALREGKLFISEKLKISEIYQLIIKGRMAMGISQLELANRLGTTQQQIQRYEATNYETASLARISEVIDALNLPIYIERFCCFKQTFDLPGEFPQEELQNHQRKLQEKGSLFFS